MVDYENLKDAVTRPKFLSQTFGLLAWLASYTLNPWIAPSILFVGNLAFCGMVMAWIITYYAKREFIWRLAGIAYVGFEAIAYKLGIMEMGIHGAIWILPVTVAICLGVTLLFIKTSDYITTVGLVIFIMLFWKDDPVSPLAGASLEAILLIAVVFLGTLQSRSFISVMESTINFREKYRHLSETDPLTTISNRRAIMDVIEQTSKEEATSYLAMIDIDDFKKINDQQGHETGDAVLVAFAKIMKSTDSRVITGRIGGEEFAVVLRGVDEDDALRILYDALDEANKGCAGVQLSFSAGLVKLEDLGLPTLLKSADEQMYIAKRSGKNQIRYCGKPFSRGVKD